MPESPLTELLASPGRKVLISRSSQVGGKLVRGWARHGIPTLGVVGFSPLELAEAVCEEASPDQATARVPDLSQTLAVDEILRGFDFRKLEAIGWSGSQMASSFRQMRVSGISPDSYKAAIPRRVAAQVAKVLDAYEKWLFKAGVTDEMLRFAFAQAAIPKIKPPALVAVMAETPISEAAKGFLESYAALAARKVIVGDADHAPAGSAAHVLDDWEFVAEPESASPNPILVRVPAVEDEARFILEDLVARELSVDQVEVAYPRHTPYLPMLLGEARRAGVPVTSAAGTPLSDLPVGQALRLFLRWIESGQDSSDLVRLLRSQLVRLPDQVPAGRVVDLLLRIHVSGGAKPFSRAFDALRKEAQGEAMQAAGTERERASKEAVKRIKAASRATLRLFDYVPDREDTTRAFAGRLRRVVEALVPPTDDPESPASKGRADVMARLEGIEGGPDSSHATRHLVRRFQSWLDGMIVQARRDSPATLHITPLDSAGLAGRPHLYVIGLDSGSFLPSPVEDVFLPDGFCDEHAAGPLSSEDRVEQRRFALKRAMARTRGTVTVVLAEGSIASDSDTGPSSTFIALEGGDSKPAVSVPHGRGSTRLALRHRSHGRGAELVASRHPALAQGALAAEHRASEVFSDYDGFVGERESVAITLAKPLSASRLQKLATCPFQYFLAEVLRVKPLDERRRNQWMTGRENGTLVHEALSRFNREIMAGEAEAGDEKRLKKLLLDEFNAFRRANSEPSEFAWRAKMREIDRIARVVTAPAREVLAAELGFGMPEWRSEAGDVRGEFALELGEAKILLRGRIDVVERTSGGIQITDYKTSRTSADFKEADLLDEGRRLQWVLYAYAFENMTGEDVAASGYLFVSGSEAGRRVEGVPPDRDAVGKMLTGQLNLARRGAFGASVSSPDYQPCKWCDFKRVCGNLDDRRREVLSKIESEAVPDVSGWAYAEKVLA